MRKENAVATLLAVAALMVSQFGLSAAHGDVIRFKQGGEVRGKLLKRAANDPEIILETLTGATLVVQRDDIDFVTIRPVEAEEYETRARKLVDTIENHLELAEWCQQQRLYRQREEQLEAVLLLDPYHADTHKALGHVIEDGEWMTKDEQMAQRGYIKHKGRYITQQQFDLLEKSAEQRAAEKEWYPKIKSWRFGVLANDSRKVTEALEEFHQIVDPAAVPGLKQYLATDDDNRVRRLLVEVLGQIPGAAATNALVERAVLDGDFDIRKAAIDAIKPPHVELATPEFARALLSNDVATVNRAAYALGKLGDERAIPALIDALVTTHKMTFYINDSNPVSNAGSGVSLGNPNTGSQNASPNVPYPPGSVVLPPQGTVTRQRKVQRRVDFANEEVLAALRTLTQQDFGYDERTWKLWWAARTDAGAHLPARAG